MKNKAPKKYNIPKRSIKLQKSHIIYVCSIITMFAAIGSALLILPRTSGNSQTVEASSNSSYRYNLIGQSRSSSSSRPVPKPISQSNTASEAPIITGSGALNNTSSVTAQSAPNSASGSHNVSVSIPQSSRPNTQSSKPQSVQSPISNSQTPSVNIPPVADQTIFTNGIAIVGTRAMTLYQANSSAFVKYAEALNRFKEALPDVNCYCTLIPTACEFYGSAEVNAKCTSQRNDINVAVKNLKNIKYADAYSELAAHTNEDIYLRTDHHWAPLGGYYAAKAFAEAAGVPFLPLSDYTEKVNTGYVGTMYGYSGNNAIIKNNPENFVYYVPKTVDWTTTYYNFKLSGGKVVGIDEPFKAAFFLNYGDNSGDNYCTFMGGDAKIVHVETETKNGRRLAIFKESFGNPIPGYLFGSFEEIYVLDQRYFPYNAIDYIKEHNITDVLFANNTTAAANTAMSAMYDTIRTQADFGL